MTLTAKDHFEAGDLPAAIDALNAEVKRHPTDTDKRGFLAEMLCFDGNLERADLMLDAIAKQDTGAIQLRLFLFDLGHNLKSCVGLFADRKFRRRKLQNPARNRFSLKTT